MRSLYGSGAPPVRLTRAEEPTEKDDEVLNRSIVNERPYLSGAPLVRLAGTEKLSWKDRRSAEKELRRIGAKEWLKA
jgi:hypothetical protein